MMITMMLMMMTMMMLTLECLLFASYHCWQMDSPTPSGYRGTFIMMRINTLSLDEDYDDEYIDVDVDDDEDDTCCTSNVEEVLRLQQMLFGPDILIMKS